jgi:hypothetical protein
MGICGLLLVAVIIAPTRPTEDTIWKYFRAGDIDTIRPLLTSLPETSATVEFFHALFETDGEVARAKYERLLADRAGSTAEPYALGRLKEYYRARGDSASVAFYQKLLDRRRAESRQSASSPAPAAMTTSAPPTRGSSLSVVDTIKATPKTGTWTVQVGAFKSGKTAKATGKKVAKYGAVSFIPKAVQKGKVTLVQVGQLATRADAEKLAQSIQSATGLKARVVQNEK